MRTLSWGCAGLGAMLAAVVLVLGVIGAAGAPGQAAAAGIACACAIIPYVMARTVSELKKDE